MHINPYLIIEDEKYLVDDFKFGFRQKPNVAGLPIEVPVFEGLHVVIRGHYPGFFLERWACASNQSKLVELVLKPLVFGSGPTRVFTFFDAHLVDFTKNYSEKKNPPVEMILKITAGGVRDSFSKSEYTAPWRETFEKPCTVVAQSTTEEECVDSGENNATEQVKLDTATKYKPDHGDFYDPIINPQVRGWYGGGHLNKDSDIPKWNPYASMKIHKHADHIKDEKVRRYGDPQRGGRGHQGLDLYAPVGTPIYACVDGKLTMHRITKGSAGFKIKLEGKYKGEHIRFNYIHLMQFKKTKFRFYNQNSVGKLGGCGWLNYSDFTTEKQFIDPKKKETYTIHYDNGILKIDQNEIDIELAIQIEEGNTVKKGQIIGYTGSTGNSYQGKKANHLHFNTYINWKSVLPYETFKEYIGLDISGTETSKKQDGITPSSEW